MPRTVIEKRLNALAKQLPGVEAGEVEAVHQARVASRRLREALPVLLGAADPAEARRLRRLVRRVTRALGRLRELDVSLGVLDGLAVGRPDLDFPIATVGQTIGTARRAAHGTALGELASVDVDLLQASAAALADAAGDRQGIRRCRLLLARRIGARAHALETAVAATGRLYAVDRLHEVRIAAKKLRYALEIAGELRGVGVVSALGRLKVLQDLLGRLHDLDVVASHVRDAACAAGRTRVSFDALAGAIESEIREIHGRFLDERETLDAVFRQCRRVRLQVAPPAWRMARAGARPDDRLASSE